jgi:hypothetical protein
MSKEKIISIVVLVLIAGGLVSWAVLGKKAAPAVATAQPVATVNGVALNQADFDTQYAAAVTSLKAQGTDTTSSTSVKTIKQQVLDGMIANELVMQGIAKAGLKANDADVETQYQTLLSQAGDADKLKAQLAAANMTDIQLRENIAKQLAIQSYLLANIDQTKTTVTDAEIKKFYDDNTKGQKDVPALKDVSAQIKQQLVLNKQQALVNEFIAKLKAEATITTNLPN